MTAPVSEPSWQPFRKSTFSADGACVEVSMSDDGRVRVRDSKQVSGTSFELQFDSREWNAFVLGVRAGEFEVLG